MKTQKIEVKILGLSDIMFDRFIDHSQEKRPPEQKLYLNEGDRICLPAENIYSLLFSENGGCAATFEGKKRKDYIRMGMSHVFIDPPLINFKNDKDDITYPTKQIWIGKFSPVTKKGNLKIKQELKERPILKTPWHLSFSINLIENPLIDATKLYNWIGAGGIQIGLGTFRPRYGRFTVEEWQEV